MLTIVGIIVLKPGQEQAFERGIAQLFESVAAEPGCHGVTWGPTETAGEYALVERYADRPALEAHRASAHQKSIGPQLAAMFAKPITIARFIEQREL